ncbi:MAG: ASKHA domain-containing protein [Suipraeoptans sp.]
MLIDKFEINISKENVLSIIDCYEDSPIYDAVIDEYETLLCEAFSLLHPKAVLEIAPLESLTEDTNVSDIEASLGSLPNITEVIYCIITVGGDISSLSSKLFENGDYLGGMIVDAIADDALFQMGHDINVYLKNICKKKNKGIFKRLEAPQDIPMTTQYTSVRKTNCEEILRLTLSDGLMLNPVKSTSCIFLLDDASEALNLEHDCSKCPRIDCKHRTNKKITVTIKYSNDTSDNHTEITGISGMSLFRILNDNNIYISTPCAGNGTCGKCKVKVLRGNVPISDTDKRHLSLTELKSGYRLACKAFPLYDCSIELPTQTDNFSQIISMQTEASAPADVSDIISLGVALGVAIDIGTTTIAGSLFDMSDRHLIKTHTSVNPQRTYGNDVLSRINSANDGNLDKLKKIIKDELKNTLITLLNGCDTSLTKVVIAGNTTMIHLLMGYSCQTLGVYPFTPVNISAIESTCDELLGIIGPVPITIFPGISTYVGGDIVSGLYLHSFDNQKKITAFIDLGTNGEMALGNNETLLVTSAAAGPAFEGGNISCGIAAIDGAISNVTIRTKSDSSKPDSYKHDSDNSDIDDYEISISTIGNTHATGICGSGIIEAAYEMRRCNIIDETGYMTEDFCEHGFTLSPGITVTKKDIRELQLAKSAIRAALETLIVEYETTYDNIDKVYIAGGFGYHLNIEKAVGIELLPHELMHKICFCGNSSLEGAAKMLFDNDADYQINHIIKSAKEVSLADSSIFQNFYMQYMYFTNS